MNELEFQRRVVKSVKAKGGYACKIGSRWQVGVPDLLVGYAEFGLVLVECKYLGEIKTLDKDYALLLTSPQRQHLLDANHLLKERVGLVLVGFKYNGKLYSCEAEPTQETVNPSGSPDLHRWEKDRFVAEEWL